MTTLEARIGIPVPGSQGQQENGADQGADAASTAEKPYGRLLRLAEAFLDRLERHYRGSGEPPPNRNDRDRGGSSPPRPLALRPESARSESFTPNSTATVGLSEPGQPADQPDPGQSGSLGWRIEQLVERCLTLAESCFGCPSSGTAEQRCRRLEEQSWRWIYREDLPPRRQLSPLDRALADRAAHGASLAVMPMRLAETFVAVSGTYVTERPSFERFMETTLLIHDALARICGEGLPARPRLGARRARISIGAAIDVSACCQGRGKGERRQLLACLSEDLRRSFEQALI